MFGNKKNKSEKKKINLNIAKSDNNKIEKKKKVKVNVAKTPEQEANATFLTTLIISSTIALILVFYNIYYIVKYDPSINISADTTQVDKIKDFIKAANVDKYEAMIKAHESANSKGNMDIKVIHSAIGREYPFTPILNKTADNTSTKLFKFIYSELKPSIISYGITNNGALPYLDNSNTDIDLNKLSSLLNIKDEDITAYTYKYYKDNGSIKVYKDDVEFPIVLFDVQGFTLKDVNSYEANIVQGKYDFILAPMEEYNNIRLQSINYYNKSIILIDTLTGKTVKLSKG